LGINIFKEIKYPVIKQSIIYFSVVRIYIVSFGCCWMEKNHIFLLFAIMALFAIPLSQAAGPAAVNLRSSGNFAILSKSGISTTGTTSVVGNIGVSPISSTAITGFGLILDPSTQFATSSLVNGKVYAADYSPPTPATMTTAISDMQTAYTDAAGRTNPSNTELGAGNIDGMTLYPGLYKWSTGVTIPTGVTLNCQGNSSSVFIFQIAQNLNVGNGAIVTLSGGCQPQNIFWQVAGQATLGTTSNVKGIILSQTAIVINTGATLTGAALAQTAVTLNADTVTGSTGVAVTTTVSTTASTSATTTGSTAYTTIMGGSTTAPTTTVVGGGGSTAPTTTIGNSATTVTTVTTTTTTIGSGSIVLATTIVGSSKLSFIWQGSGYYEIPSGGPNIPATGMTPGVTYLVTNQAFIQYVDAWLAS
jgi:hypothetical protein